MPSRKGRVLEAAADMGDRPIRYMSSSSIPTVQRRQVSYGYKRTASESRADEKQVWGKRSSDFDECLSLTSTRRKRRHSSLIRFLPNRFVSDLACHLSLRLTKTR